MVDIFLSYESSDRQRIQPLILGLQAEGWVVFWDRKIPAGQTWRQYLGRRLDDARCVVVAWSKTSIQSEWVIEEADQGKGKKALLPLLLDDVEPPLGFRTIQAANLVDWPGDLEAPAWLELLANIRDLLQPANTPVVHFDDQIEAAVEKKGGRVVPTPSALPVPRQYRLSKWVIGLSITTLLLVVSGGLLSIGLLPKPSKPDHIVASPKATQPAKGLVRQAQTLLQKLGYNVAIDDILSPQTLDAIYDFQAKSGLPKAGTVDDKLILDLVSKVKVHLHEQILRMQRETNSLQPEPGMEAKMKRLEELHKEADELLKIP